MKLDVSKEEDIPYSEIGSSAGRILELIRGTCDGTIQRIDSYSFLIAKSMYSTMSGLTVLYTFSLCFIRDRS